MTRSLKIEINRSKGLSQNMWALIIKDSVTAEILVVSAIFEYSLPTSLFIPFSLLNLIFNFLVRNFSSALPKHNQFKVEIYIATKQHLHFQLLLALYVDFKLSRHWAAQINLEYFAHRFWNWS